MAWIRESNDPQFIEKLLKYRPRSLRKWSIKKAKESLRKTHPKCHLKSSFEKIESFKMMTSLWQESIVWHHENDHQAAMEKEKEVGERRRKSFSLFLISEKGDHFGGRRRYYKIDVFWSWDFRKPFFRVVRSKMSSSSHQPSSNVPSYTYEHIYLDELFKISKYCIWRVLQNYRFRLFFSPIVCVLRFADLWAVEKEPVYSVIVSKAPLRPKKNHTGKNAVFRIQLISGRPAIERVHIRKRSGRSQTYF